MAFGSLNFENVKWKKGAFRESNSGPLAPKARIIPLDQMPWLNILYSLNQIYCKLYCTFLRATISQCVVGEVVFSIVVGKLIDRLPEIFGWMKIMNRKSTISCHIKKHKKKFKWVTFFLMLTTKLRIYHQINCFSF